MAYNKGDEIKNKIKTFSQSLMLVKMFKFLLFFYSFLSFLFWFLNCFEFEWLYLFDWMFMIPYKIVNVFYKPAGLSADFSLAIIGVISLIAGLAFEFLSGSLYQKISDLQDEYDKYIEQKKRQKPRRPRPVPHGGNDYPQALYSRTQSFAADDNLMLVFIIQPHIHKIKSLPGTIDLTFQEVELWRQRINKQILEDLKYSKPMQKGYYRKNLFLVYRDFNYVDDFVYYMRPTIESIIALFKKYDIEVTFSYVLSVAAQLPLLEKELDIMDTILSLNFINMFILTSKFKQAYEIRTVPKYKMESKGEYNLSKNLTVSNLQPLFVFKDVYNQGEQV